MRRNVSSFKELRAVAPADSLSAEVEHFSLTTLKVVSPKYDIFKSLVIFQINSSSVVFNVLIYLGFEIGHLLTCLKSICVGPQSCYIRQVEALHKSPTTRKTE